MQIHLSVNGNDHEIDVTPGELLRTTLRRLRYFSVKHGDETGESGADAVLLTRQPDAPASYRLVNSGVMLAAQADGASIVTVEGLSGPRNEDLHPLQEEFVACGAIQCGYCTPAQLLAAKNLLDENPNPSEAQVREAIAGVLCRCTGYTKPVEAVLRTAARAARRRSAAAGTQRRRCARRRRVAHVAMNRTSRMRSHPAAATRRRSPVRCRPSWPRPRPPWSTSRSPRSMPSSWPRGAPSSPTTWRCRACCYGGLLTSPHAHARILSIDASKALALPGVHAVLTHEDVERVIYASGGQSYPQPPPYDQVSLDNKVRHVGDRVAIVAAETPGSGAAGVGSDRGRV